MKMGISELPQCQYKNCKNQVYLNWDLKLTTGCSQSHSQKITYQKLYGVDCNLQLENTKELIKQTNIERYGVEYASQSPEIKERVKQTNLNRYGVTNPFSSGKIKDKIKQTNIERYGFENAMQNSMVFSKSQKKSYYYKEYMWDTGEISMVQGYEPIVLKELEGQGVMYAEVVTTIKDIPHFFYEFNGQTHKYIPDIYIPSKNLIIEVKSEYTMKLHYERNLLKFKAVVDAGFNFKLEIR